MGSKKERLRQRAERIARDRSTKQEKQEKHIQPLADNSTKINALTKEVS